MFSYQNLSERGSFLALAQNEEIQLKDKMIIRFGDKNTFTIMIAPLKILLSISKPGACKLCGEKQMKYIAYPCLHFYACEDCYKDKDNQDECLFCK